MHIESPPVSFEPRLEPPEDFSTLEEQLWPGGTRRDSRGELTLAGHQVSDLVAQYGTPLYVIDEADFRRRARSFTEHFPGWSIHYAGKSFLCRTVARWINEEGLCLDVCSGNELAVALSVGFPPERISLHGNNKTSEELRYGVKAGVGCIVVDSFDEIDRLRVISDDLGRPVPVMVRVTTGIHAETHQYVATSHEDQKFGLSIQSGQALKALLICHDQPQFDLLGIHSHIGSQILEVEGFARAAQITLSLVSQFQDATNDSIQEVNLGGGFGIAYVGSDEPWEMERLSDVLIRDVEKGCHYYDIPETKFAIEPGRAISGPPGVALYTVGTIKDVDIGEGFSRRYVSVDGGMSDNIRTALYDADYTATLANRTSVATPTLSRVVGIHCETGDVLVKDVYLPDDLALGDILAIPASGAYSRAMASNYNYALKPAVVGVVEGDTQVMLRRETLDDLLRLDQGEIGVGFEVEREV
ncbi:MAG: diaminopimelate decarboxylase [Propionibacteriaceae bacterium]|nr:diaminopimelate decarboxylase [Propionibacteriaceae bacterium]